MNSFIKKKLDVQAITSELRGNSAFFRTDKQKSERANARTDERQKTRHSFNIFADQLLSLKELVLQKEKAHGNTVYLADLVREALDLYITRERENERTPERRDERPRARTSARTGEQAHA